MDEAIGLNLNQIIAELQWWNKIQVELGAELRFCNSVCVNGTVDNFS
jgi:hypothetical protein